MPAVDITTISRRFSRDEIVVMRSRQISSCGDSLPSRLPSFDETLLRAAAMTLNYSGFGCAAFTAAMASFQVVVPLT